MVKKPSSKPADNDTAASTSAEHAIFQAQEDRIADLERRIVEMNEQLSLVLAAVPVDTPLNAQLVEQQNERLTELQRVVGNLGERLAAAQHVNAREEQFNAALRSVEAAAAAVQRGVAPAVAATAGVAPVPAHDCDCAGCECVNCATCCVFEIWISHIRCDQMQNPIMDPGLPPFTPVAPDSNINPTSMLEIWGFATIDPVNKIGVCIPNADPASNVPLHKQMFAVTGPWVATPHCVGTVMVKKGIPKTVTIDVTFVEREDALERIQPMNRDEWGSNTGTVTLDCCYSNYSPIDIPVDLTNWGQAGGAVTGRFIVVKRC